MKPKYFRFGKLPKMEPRLPEGVNTVEGNQGSASPLIRKDSSKGFDLHDILEIMVKKFRGGSTSSIDL